MKNRSSKSLVPAGFSLLELLVAIVIFVILTAIIITGVSQVQELAMKTKCASNLRQIGMATQVYISENDAFPPANMHKALLPYLEMQPPDYDLYCCPADPRVDEWKAAAASASSGGENPADVYPGMRSSYVYNAHLIGFATTENRWKSIAWVRAITLPFEVENPAETIFMYDSDSYYFGDRSVRTADFRHGSGINVLYADGHVATFTEGSEEFYLPKYW